MAGDFDKLVQVIAEKKPIIWEERAAKLLTKQERFEGESLSEDTIRELNELARQAEVRRVECQKQLESLGVVDLFQQIVDSKLVINGWKLEVTTVGGIPILKTPQLLPAILEVDINAPSAVLSYDLRKEHCYDPQEGSYFMDQKRIAVQVRDGQLNLNGKPIADKSEVIELVGRQLAEYSYPYDYVEVETKSLSERLKEGVEDAVIVFFDVFMETFDINK